MTTMRTKSLSCFVALALIGSVSMGADAPITLTVQANRSGVRINPAMWGIFFEDINLGADGGLYAELVKNRSFEFPDHLAGWQKLSPSMANGTLSIREQDPFNAANPHYLRIQSEGTAPFGVFNEGFRGIGLRQDEAYNFSARIRAAAGSPVLRIELYGSDGTRLDSVSLKNFSTNWNEYTATLHPKDTDPKASLYVVLANRGAVELDMVSLFPERTWKDRPRGLRPDMVQMLADLQPGFLRFPGGCVVEGSHLDRRYQWKATIGPVAERKLLVNRWNYEFLHRPTPDYYQSFGLGFFEFFQLCEDIGAAPLPIINCGMACQFNTSELVPLNQLDPYIQDALDLIEFANGPATSTWGAKRAAMGHPAPFNLKMMGIGNEQWGPQYLERYTAFAKVLKEKHPEISLISDAGPSPADDRFVFLWPKLIGLHADIVDQHCYANPIWFLANAHRYDQYDRNGPKIFMGEYAAQSVAIVSTKNRNNLECALAEAAFMTGLERNADVVRMASYAPLFAHVEGWQWTPNLIWTDNLRVYGTPNYYVQQLFCRNRGDVTVPVELSGVEMSTEPSGCIGLGTYQTSAEFKDLQVTRNGQTLLGADFAKDASGWTSEHKNKWTVKDGAYQQSDKNGTDTVTIGDPAWTDYTISLKARKLEGKEGFMVRVRHHGPEDYVVWNLGGFSNKTHSIQYRFAQQDHMLTQMPGSIDAGRWYDLKIQLQGTKVDCYLDGRLVQSAEAPTVHTQRLYASAARDEKTGELIVKVVNPGDDSRETQIKLAGLSGVGPETKAIVLTGGAGSEVNSLDAPRHVVPQESSFKTAGPDFEHTFPARSFTVMRFATRQL
jgi:alpha-L-arabinofuranosidase